MLSQTTVRVNCLYCCPIVDKIEKSTLAIHQPNVHYILNTYLDHTSPTRFGVFHTIFTENLRIRYSKPSAFTKLLSVIHWLCRKM